MDKFGMILICLIFIFGWVSIIRLVIKYDKIDEEINKKIKQFDEEYNKMNTK